MVRSVDCREDSDEATSEVWHSARYGRDDWRLYNAGDDWRLYNAGIRNRRLGDVPMIHQQGGQ